MPLYKPGDVCVGRGFTLPHAIKFNGIECTILRVYSIEEAKRFRPGTWYEVDWANAETQFIVVMEPFLRLKRPPEELSSWRSIEELIGFHPDKVIAEAKTQNPVVTMSRNRIFYK